ncbi:hypothetical protein N473_08550 [Pseudoalteromonas luteoviolacea CPMOR-1]|uniref:Uncharacterized protein n=1 Tax=Pseudoalteromonas luteoviolacea CPMOR-1 TaxID=1365248 RepID=A0A167MHN3_9GAMM|nr:hypothetical protein [Pseudoalteromonas luteoviolacea]KZN66430.1 hypothetical protein N473_08550 [Pseudoalteromonas luteoviolacea CPMOR-1]
MARTLTFILIFNLVACSPTQPISKYRNVYGVKVEATISIELAQIIINHVKKCSDFSCITDDEHKWILNWFDVYEYDKPYRISLYTVNNFKVENKRVYLVELDVKDDFGHLSYCLIEENGGFKIIGISHGEVG